jgi:glucan phosphorylase
MNTTRDVSPRKIAYFSMEVGIGAQIPTYSGGLGVLAGDTIRAAADLKVPMVACITKATFTSGLMPMAGKARNRWNGLSRIF